MADIVSFLNTTQIDTSRVVHPLQQEFVRAMCTTDIKKHLFPNGYITVDWMPFSIKPNNLRYIYEVCHILWSTGDYFNDQGPSISLLSCLNVMFCESGLRMDVILYGQDTAQIAVHVYTGMKYLSSMYPGYSDMVEQNNDAKSKLEQRGAQGIVLGCTEIPLIIKKEDTRLPVFDTLELHAKAAVEFALE